MKYLKTFQLLEFNGNRPTTGNEPTPVYGNIESETNRNTIIKEFNKKSKDGIIMINNDTTCMVGLDKRIMSLSRTYYIVFKGIKDKNNQLAALKLVYDLNKRSNNFKVYDNYNNEIEFKLLEISLQKNGLSYGEFNHAWYYIENDFNNQSY